MAENEGLVPNPGPDIDPNAVSVDPNAPPDIDPNRSGPVEPGNITDRAAYDRALAEGRIGELPGGANVAPPAVAEAPE